MPKMVPHVVTVGSTRVGVFLPDIYTDIATIVGVSKVTDANLPEVTMEVRDLIRKAQVVRLNVSYVLNGKRKLARVICDLSKLKTAVAQLPTKTFRGGDIRSAYLPVQRRLG